MNIKNILKAIKLNESTISMVLGALVIIVVGVLVVNYFKDKEGKGTLPTVSTTQENKVEVGEGETHKVEKGESLWKIAEKVYGSGYNWVDIAKENNLKNPNRLLAGQELELPEVEPRLLTINSILTGKEKVETVNKISGATYEVVKGDILWKIAVRAYGDGYKWVEIAKANKLVNPNLIHRGNILVIPR